MNVNKTQFLAANILLAINTSLLWPSDITAHSSSVMLFWVFNHSLFPVFVSGGGVGGYRWNAYSIGCESAVGAGQSPIPHFLPLMPPLLLPIFSQRALGHYLPECRSVSQSDCHFRDRRKQTKCCLDVRVHAWHLLVEPLQIRSLQWAVDCGPFTLALWRLLLLSATVVLRSLRLVT